MKLRRRILGLVAVLAIAWGALWPLVSTAGPREARVPNVICTQGGHIEQPAAPGEDKAGAKFHCSLCVTPADAAPAITLTPIIALDAPRAVESAPTPSPPLLRFSARSPPSRAPPRYS